MSKLIPKYTLWEAINAAIMGVQRALEEIRTLARTPGPPGLGFDDMVMTYDGKRRFTFVMTRGDQKKEYSFTMPVILDCGVYKEGHDYVTGDAVSWGGELYIAQAPTTAKPRTPEAKDDWRLACKKGRDGKDGVVRTVNERSVVKIGKP